MTIPELAAKLVVSTQTIYGWRHRGIGPKGFKAGGRIRYRECDVLAWIDQQSDWRGAV